MKITVEIDDKSYELDVPAGLPGEAEDFFGRMDADMDRGWRMSRWWVPDPDPSQRCQIAADKLLTAIQKNRKPSTRRIRVNTAGEIQGNEFFDD